MSQGTIRRGQNPPLSGTIDDTDWEQAEPLHIDHYPWYESGPKHATTVRLLYDDWALYLQFLAEDNHCSASVTELNGPVFRDSCVEFFASPEPVEQSQYFNFEANCCGTMHLGFGPPDDRRLIGSDLADKIRVETSIPGPTTSGPPPGNRWWLAAALPFDVLGEFIGVDIAPTTGTNWQANLFRCGGEVDAEPAVWADIDASKRDFHQPDEFGTLVFA